MNFDLTEEQQVVSDLAQQIFSGQATVERVKAAEKAGTGFDADLWSALADANLLGLCLPEADGGSGLSLVELVLILRQQGRTVAPVPLWATLCLGAIPLARFGTAAQRAQWLPGVIDGSVILTGALAESGANDPMLPSVTAVAANGQWSLSGWKPTVSGLPLAQQVLVPARQSDGSLGVFLVDPDGPGAEVQPVEATNHESQGHLLLDGAIAERLGGDDLDGQVVLSAMVELALVGLCALQLGVAEAATEQTAVYTSGRLQFGKPLSTFQAVAHQAADAYILIEALRVTTLQAAWRLSEGLDARSEVLAAKWWASEGGQKVVHLCQHLHGGMGADVDYPIHRYFLWGVQIESSLGGASAQLSRLGELLAEAGRS